MDKIKKLISISPSANAKLKQFSINNGINESVIVETLINNYLENIRLTCSKAKTVNIENNAK